MRTAVIYSGHARTFEHVFDNHFFHVLRKLPNPEFFVSVVNDDDAIHMGRIRERFPTGSFHMETVDQPQIPEPPRDPHLLAGYENSSPIQAILRQFWHLNRAWEFLQITAPDCRSSPFDLVVRIRPDLAFHRFDLERFPHAQECFSPWWSRWGGMNDRFALMGWDAAFRYFTTFERIAAIQKLLGCPLHPETLLLTSLQAGGIRNYSTLAAEFRTIRKDGSFVLMDPSLSDITTYARNK